MDHQEDLVVIEFLKLARVMKRQIKIISNNLDKIKIEDLERISSIIRLLENDLNRFKLVYSKGLNNE